MAGMMDAPTLNHLLPKQYQSWLRKIDDPEWVGHRYRTAPDRAMANAIRELRDALRRERVLRCAVETLLCERDGDSGNLDDTLLEARLEADCEDRFVEGLTVAGEGTDA